MPTVYILCISQLTSRMPIPILEDKFYVKTDVYHYNIITYLHLLTVIKKCCTDLK